MAKIAEDQEKYEKLINSLIVHAEQEAETKVAQLGKADEMRPGAKKTMCEHKNIYRHDFFTEFYHEAMNRMAREMGYRDL